jgi:ribosomal-protein-alanine N-acetyltransferase
MLGLGLQTERLALRRPAAEDYSAYRLFYSDPEASGFYGGPLSPALAWRKLAYDIGHWSLRGFGQWMILARESGRVIGGCGIVQPEGWPRHELTWWVLPTERRRGFAFEASKAVVAWAYDDCGFDRVETHMKDDNAAAVSLATKLGGVIIARETFPDGLERNIYALPR